MRAGWRAGGAKEGSATCCVSPPVAPSSHSFQPWKAQADNLLSFLARAKIQAGLSTFYVLVTNVILGWGCVGYFMGGDSIKMML